ncbi:MAG: DegV family protein [Oscillospiraceae bacterium]|nr:DegV family protein [Oscillospiraceae bacterium]
MSNLSKGNHPDKPVTISTDSACDLVLPLREEFSVAVLPLYINVEGEFFKDGVDIFPPDIFRIYEERGIIPKTAAASVGDYLSFFQQYTGQGRAVVHVSLSSRLSSSFRNAMLAAAELEDVYVVDSLAFTVAQGMLTVQGCLLRDQGFTAREVAARLEQLRHKIRAYFIVDKLDFLVKGGRCSAVNAFGANLLSLRPSIVINAQNGDLVVGKKYRGKLAAVQESFLRDCAAASADFDPAMLWCMHTPDMQPAQYEPLRHLAQELFPQVGRLVLGAITGCMIVSHCGKNCIAFVALEK